jgi:ribosomal protein L37E
MGIVCDRCGSINRLEDRHCGACGQPLAASLKQDVARPAPAEKTQLVGTRQYTTSEIEELLLLRKAMKANEQSNKIMNQDEIDNLFK